MCLTQCQGCKQSLIRGQHGILWSTSTNMNMTGEAPTLSFVCRRLISDILWKFAHHRHNWFKIWPKRTVGVVYLNRWGTVEKRFEKGLQYSVWWEKENFTDYKRALYRMWHFVKSNDLIFIYVGGCVLVDGKTNAEIGNIEKVLSCKDGKITVSIYLVRAISDLHTMGAATFSHYC